MQVTCDNCGKAFMMPDSMAGKTGRCPGCGISTRVPRWGSPNIAAGEMLRKHGSVILLAVALILTILLSGRARRNLRTQLEGRLDTVAKQQQDLTSSETALAQRVDQMVSTKTERMATLNHVETLAREQNARTDALVSKAATKEYVDAKLEPLAQLAQVAPLAERVAALEAGLKGAKAELSAGIEAAQTQIGGKLDESGDRVAAVEGQVKAIHDLVAKAGQDAKGVGEQVVELRGRLEKIAALEMRVGAAEAATQQLQTAIGSANEALKAQTTALDGRLKGAETAMLDLKETLRATRDADQGVGVKVEAVEKALGEVRAALAALQGKVDAIERRVDSIATRADAGRAD